MPKFSAFTPYGLLKFSGRRPGGQDIYEALVSGQDSALDMAQGTPAEAEAYALAMACARTRAVLERAKNQRVPDKAFDMLAEIEKDFGIIPGESDTIRTRQRAVAARKLISRGSREESIQSALSALLGADFVTYRVLTTGEAVNWPSNPTTGPGVFGRDDIPSKVFYLTSSISITGTPTTFTYARYGADDGARLQGGDIVSVSPENAVIAERVTIASVSGLTATSTFTKAHDANDTLSTGPVPIWTSTKRHVLVVVAATAVLDLEKRRKIHDLMGRISRGVTTWSIVKASSATTVGPTVCGSYLGTTIIGTLTIP